MGTNTTSALCSREQTSRSSPTVCCHQTIPGGKMIESASSTEWMVTMCGWFNAAMPVPRAGIARGAPDRWSRHQAGFSARSRAAAGDGAPGRPRPFHRGPVLKRFVRTESGARGKTHIGGSRDYTAGNAMTTARAAHPLAEVGLPLTGHLPRSRHLPFASTEGSLSENLNNTGVRLWTDRAQRALRRSTTSHEGPHRR